MLVIKPSAHNANLGIRLLQEVATLVQVVSYVISNLFVLHHAFWEMNHLILLVFPALLQIFGIV